MSTEDEIKKLETERQRLEDEGSAKFDLARKKEEKVKNLKTKIFWYSEILSKINFEVRYIDGTGGPRDGWVMAGTFQLDSVYDEKLLRIIDEILTLFPSSWGDVSLSLAEGVKFYLHDNDISLSFDSPEIGLEFLKTHKIKVSTKGLDVKAEQAEDKAKMLRQLINIFEENKHDGGTK